ncbi:MAG TPA: class I SAM-dependent methyltransferase [Methanocella sp.]|uniref:class I SAM-dependent DNA methyltransferase n=1 Tax=Methanocella sp. TaxID=2052833 RepID=UPI002CAF5622|nr:class I SAM-dependent methyltransferase [Methanocella sp.]HTY91258.1 class I SAM-dependent methyltransferase [Methanocella sp.]
MDQAESLRKFYSGFAGKYDLFMPWEQRILRERRFFKYMLDTYNVNSVLDCFCGTGFHLAMLSEMGYDVEGIDISPDMVNKARENLKARGLEPMIALGDVKAINTKKKYDCVLSMGNSLPHEFGDDNILKALKSMHDALNPGGICIVHIENFDRLYEDRELFIPSRHRRDDTGSDIFIFAIEYYEGRVVFNILSVIERGGLPKFAVDTVEYYPIKAGRLRELINETGFGEIRCYEDFRMSPPGRDRTYDIIMVAKKDDNK